MASFVFFSACLVFFTAANWWINSSTLTAQKPTYSLGTNDERRTIFLFEDGYLVDATNTAKALLKDISQPSNLDDWAHFKSAVTDDFADLDAHAETAVSLGHSTLKSHRDERLSLNFEAVHTLIRVELQGTSVTQKTSADLLLGMVLDGLGMMLLTLPVVYPAIIGLGYDPIWFGILLVKLIEVGVVTPPVGLNCYVVNGIRPDIPLENVFKGVVPFLLGEVIIISAIILFSELVMFLPNLMK